jgi:hypothetical protein
MKSLYVTTIGLFFFVSCTYDCARSLGVMPNFISFSEQEVEYFVIRKFEKGSSFSKLIDSIVVNRTISYKRSNDTLRAVSYTGNNRMQSDFDYIVYMPTTNSSFQITEMNEPQKQGHKSTKKIMCINQITSCKINGQFTAISYDNIYLGK